MLLELAVSDLGVLADVSLVLASGMTALTGETGAGKTLLVEAIELLVGGRADGVLVRSGAAEARVEGRFDLDGDEVVLARVVPRDGRSRAYVNGRLATAATLAELGARLVDLHGQHTHQSLLGTAVQRAALDRFGRVDLAPLSDARAALAEIERDLAALGGDERARVREIDLLRFQVAELDAARLDDPEEDRALEVEEDALADAVAHQDAASAALASLTADGGALDVLGEAIAALAGRSPFGEHSERLRSAAAELGDVAADVRATGEAIADDPERLAAVRARRQLLHELRRKYGETLADVLAFGEQARARVRQLEAHDQQAAELDARRAVAVGAVAGAAAVVGRARRATAPTLAAAAQGHLAELAMAGAQLGISVGDVDPGDDVTFMLAANTGTPLLPLTKVASGGELARTMLALRLVLTGDDGPPTLVFDEVDAGVGGEAALAVGRALAALGATRQVLVVTHLPQVAAFADAQVAVTKCDDGRTTIAGAATLDESARVVELSRMLSGQPESTRAHDHAEELLAAAARQRGR